MKQLSTRWKVSRCSTRGEEGICRSPNIPDELMFAIFVLLPVKCLLRFKCVSKYWFQLICRPDFIKLYLQKSCDDANYNHHQLLYMGREGGRSDALPTFRYAPLHPTLCEPELYAKLQTDLSHPMKFVPGESLSFVGSYNGLVCITSAKNSVIIWNPTIKKCKQLPKFGRGSPIFYGFGYDESSDDYKVVGIHKSCFKRYSARTNRWKKLQGNFEALGVDSHGCFLNGNLHWATKENIFTIDLSSEIASVMEPPNCVRECSDWKVRVVGEYVVVFCYYRISHVDMWMMMRYGEKESWMKVNTKYPFDTFNDPRRCLEYIPCFVSKEGNLLLHRLRHPPTEPGEATFRVIRLDSATLWYIEHIGLSAFVVYNINRDSFSYNSTRGRRKCCNVSHPVIVYVESLVWPFP